MAPVGQLAPNVKREVELGRRDFARCGSRRGVGWSQTARKLRLDSRRDLVLGSDQRRAPCKARFVTSPRLVERIAEMLLDFGLVRVFFGRLLERPDRFVDLAALELRPAQRIGDRRVVGRKLARLADHRFGGIDVLAPLELRIAEEIEQQRLVGRDRQSLLERLLGFRPAVGVLERARAEQLESPEIVFCP